MLRSIEANRTSTSNVCWGAHPKKHLRFYLWLPLCVGEYKIIELQMDPFFDWVANKLGYFESTAGWADMILAKCMGFESRKIDWNVVFNTTPSKQQHLDSIAMFYNMLEEFKNEMDSSLQ